MKCTTNLFLVTFLFLLSCNPGNLITIGKFEDIKLTGLESGALKFQTKVEIESRYFKTIKVYADDLAVYVSDKILGKIQIVDPILIKPKEKKIYTLDFKLILSENEKGLFSLFQNFNMDTSEFVIKGNIRARSFLVRKNIQVNIALNNQ